MIGSENALNFDCCSKHHLSLLSLTAYQRLYSSLDISRDTVPETIDSGPMCITDLFQNKSLAYFSPT